ncbi:MAG: hypothetical protein RL215_2802 [Planctomycetota bacterium]|jgi:hypothetical protein
MNLTSHTELLIQRCVDDELSAADSRRLLQELDSVTGGWKCLACGLLEDRLLRKAIRSASAPTESSAAAPVALPPGINAKSALAPAPTGQLRHWWSHPLTSLSLCVAIAFLAGMLLSDRPRMPVADSASLPAPIIKPPATTPAQFGSVTLQLPQGDQAQVPVYSDFNGLLQSERNHPFLQTPNGNGSLKVLVVPDGNGRTILVPMLEDQAGSLQ